jgi:hypothetical protein
MVRHELTAIDARRSAKASAEKAVPDA